MISDNPPPSGNRLSGTDALAVLDIIHESLYCFSENDFVRLFPKIQALFPFDYAFSMLGYHEANRGLVETGSINVSFPEEWLREYRSRNYLQSDSIVLENFTTYQVQNWSFSRKTLYRKKEITALGMDFGMRECCTHGTKPAASGKSGSMFCFAGRSMANDGRIRAILDFVIPHLHLALYRICEKKEKETDRARLSNREREVLDWLKQGKSSWDISIILGISERTVNFHVNNILRKLGAANRLQALAIATRLGIIDLD